MRIGDLSRITGVPVPTIKYYQREGLVPYGEQLSRTQARYQDDHVHRLRLVRALVEVGRLPIATAKQVLATAAEPDRSTFSALGRVLYTVTATPQSDADEAPVDRLLADLGWVVKPENPSRAGLAALLVTLAELGRTDLLALLADYARLADRLAALDVGLLAGPGSRDEVLETAVVSTVLGDALVSLLRRLAQESHATRLADRG